jgi:hypothetical protein
MIRGCRRRDGLGDANAAEGKQYKAWLVALMFSSRRLGYCMDGNGKTKEQQKHRYRYEQAS